MRHHLAIGEHMQLQFQRCFVHHLRLAEPRIYLHKLRQTKYYANAAGDYPTRQSRQLHRPLPSTLIRICVHV